MTITEVAELLEMARPNVRFYLSRHGVGPIGSKPQGGALFSREAVLALKAERDASARREADRKRSEGYRRTLEERDERIEAAMAKPFGRAQQALLTHMYVPRTTRRVSARVCSPAESAALRRLRRRGLVRREDGFWSLTPEGRAAAKHCIDGH